MNNLCSMAALLRIDVQCVAARLWPTSESPQGPNVVRLDFLQHLQRGSGARSVRPMGIEINGRLKGSFGVARTLCKHVCVT
jgi:hypothetical protein